MSGKNKWLDAAEAFDAWRIFPRLLLSAYCGFVEQVTMYVLAWYTHIPAAARNINDSAVVGVIFTAIAGFSPWIFKIYIENGRDWESPQAATTETVVSSKTVTP